MTPSDAMNETNPPAVGQDVPVQPGTTEASETSVDQAPTKQPASSEAAPPVGAAAGGSPSDGAPSDSAPSDGAPSDSAPVANKVAPAKAAYPKKSGGHNPPPARVGAERLHKFLASTGAGSRRECETFIKERRVTVNSKLVTKMGTKVVPGVDVIRFDGEVVKAEKKVYWLLHKPAGVICTNDDEQGRTRVVDLVPDRGQRIYTVGRLDSESQGLILLTNDGEIANIVCHPRYRIEKVYQVAVRGTVSREQISRVEAGVWLAEGKTSPARIRALGRNPKRDETVLEMTVFEGRNREVRRVLGHVGLNVRRLMRTRVGPLKLGKLPAGGSIRLEHKDLAFVGEAEAMYLANRDVWDAEVKQQRRASSASRGGGGGQRGRGFDRGGGYRGDRDDRGGSRDFSPREPRAPRTPRREGPGSDRPPARRRPDDDGGSDRPARRFYG